MKKIIFILTIFFLDRITKIYLLNLQENGTDIDFYINSFLNFYLVWNSGIGFGLASMEADIYYHILTGVISVVNVALPVPKRVMIQNESQCIQSNAYP